MTQSIAKEIAALNRMTVGKLKAKHIEAFGEPGRSGNRDWLRKRIAWRLQANALSGLSERARQRAEELANDADLRTTAPKVKQAETEPTLTTEIAVSFDGDARLPLLCLRPHVHA